MVCIFSTQIIKRIKKVYLQSDVRPETQSFSISFYMNEIEITLKLYLLIPKEFSKSYLTGPKWRDFQFNCSG